MNEMGYLVQGTSLVALSLISLGYVLSEDAKSVLNSSVFQAHVLSIALVLSLVFTWVSGFYYFVTLSTTGKTLMEVSSVLFWMFMVASNLLILKTLVLNGGVKFGVSKNYFDVILYFGVLWLFSYHLPYISYHVLALLSTLACVLGIYFAYLLGKYYRYREFFIVPLEISNFYLSIVLTSFALGALFFARVYSYKSYLLFAILIYLVLIYGITTLAREMKMLVSKL
ncbi:hypothetical protein [Geoglobus ahangari]